MDARAPGIVKIQVFWDVTLCLYKCRFRRFGGSWYPHFHAQAVLGWVCKHYDYL